jgi:hypothetical protein
MTGAAARGAGPGCITPSELLAALRDD